MLCFDVVFLSRMVAMETWREGFQKMEKILQAVAVLDVCVNSYCFYYVKRTFNTKQVLNHILCIDAILTVLSCLVIFSTYFMETNDFKCYLLSSIYFIVPTLFLTYNFITAFIRYERVSMAMNNKSWKTDAELIKSTNAILLATFFVLILTFLFDTLMDFEMIVYFNKCLGNTPDNSDGSFLILIVRHSIVLCTICFDLKCLQLVRTFRNQANESNFHFPKREHRHILYEIPMRATIINGCFVVTAVIMGPFVITSEKEFEILGVFILTFSLIKTPIMILLTFRVNATTARVDQDEERERKRQVEIEEARQKQANRLARRMKMEVETTRASPLPALPNLIHVAEAPFTSCHF